MLKKILYVRKLRLNLFVPRRATKFGYKVLFEINKYKVIMNNDSEILNGRLKAMH